MGKYKIDEDLLTDKNVVTSGKKGKPSQLYSLYIFRVLFTIILYYCKYICKQLYPGPQFCLSLDYTSQFC